jgi:hypothetical protein
MGGGDSNWIGRKVGGRACASSSSSSSSSGRAIIFAALQLALLRLDGCNGPADPSMSLDNWRLEFWVLVVDTLDSSDP